MLWCTHDASNVASCARRSVRVALRRQPYKRAVPNGFYLLMKHMLILEASTSRAAAAASTAVGHRLIPQGIEKAVSRTYTRSRARTYTHSLTAVRSALCVCCQRFFCGRLRARKCCTASYILSKISSACFCLHFYLFYPNRLENFVVVVAALMGFCYAIQKVFVDV